MTTQEVQNLIESLNLKENFQEIADQLFKECLGLTIVYGIGTVICIVVALFVWKQYTEKYDYIIDNVPFILFLIGIVCAVFGLIFAIGFVLYFTDLIGWKISPITTAISYISQHC
jgi:ABC-type long-subunit fatty acid transport system fused permease/ATPase subunit